MKCACRFIETFETYLNHYKHLKIFTLEGESKRKVIDWVRKVSCDIVYF